MIGAYLKLSENLKNNVSKTQPSLEARGDWNEKLRKLL